MLSFREGWKSFKSGLDKSQVLEYWSAVWAHAWEIWWGAGVIGVICTILTLYYAPSRWVLGWAVAWVFLVAGYYAWQADHVRLQQKIEVTQLLTQRYTYEGRNGMLYYFEIINKSEAHTIHGVRVQLHKIEPEVEDLNWLPVTLQQKHDNQLPHALVFDLNPNEPKNIDLISAFFGDVFFSIHHIAGIGVNQRVPTRERHALKVMITAENMPRLDKWFDVWVDHAGVLQCEMR